MIQKNIVEFFYVRNLCMTKTDGWVMGGKIILKNKRGYNPYKLLGHVHVVLFTLGQLIRVIHRLVSLRAPHFTPMLRIGLVNI